MKSFLSIRGNLLLINMVVICLILWLTISFLVIAVSERREAILLKEGMAIDKLIVDTSDALSNERQLYRSHLSIDNASTEPSLSQLTEAALNTDLKIDLMVKQVNELLLKKGFLEKIPASKKSLQEQLQALGQGQIYLSALRKLVFGSSSPLSAISRTSVQSELINLLDSPAGIQNILEILARSLKYQPDFHASSVEIYHSLLNEVLIVNAELRRSHIKLSLIIDNDLDTLPEWEIQTVALARNIEQRLATISRLAQASNDAEHLYPFALKVQEFHKLEYQSIISDLVAAISVTRREAGSASTDEFDVINAQLNQLIKQLKDETNLSLEMLATRFANRANRNLIIDIALVILSLLITVVSIVLNHRLKRYAYQDALTKLGNRLSFETTLNQIATSPDETHAVIFIDLDRFKSINDNYGHAFGDDLLKEVAARLDRICGPNDRLARLGGDEFAVLLMDIDSEATAEAMALKMIEEIEQSIAFGDLNLKVGASAGLSIAPTDCAVGVELLRNADIAMYNTKNDHQNRVSRFSREMAGTRQQRVMLELDLKKAFEKQQFNVVYQPKVCTRSGQVKSVEALLRWQHPERGYVSPAQFIPIAENIGLMGDIGYWVLNEACREIAQVRKLHFSGLQVAVNISAQQFGDEQFVERVSDALATHKLNPSSLSLEVTESIVMSDIKRVIRTLETLQASGIDIAVDDFGTGYSSLQYLQELPLNTLKIDRAFIVALDDTDPHSSVANSIIQLASLFNLETVAEGVETDEQDNKIRSLGVDHIQGYRYSKPVAASDLPEAVHSIARQHAQNEDGSRNHAA